MAVKPAPVAALQAFFASCPEMLFIAGADGKLLYWTEALSRTLGPALAEGATLADLAHPEDRHAIAAAWSELQRGTKGTEFELRLRTAAGDYLSLSCNAGRSTEDNTVHASLRKSLGGAAHPTELTKLKERLIDGIVSHVKINLWAIDDKGKFIFQDGRVPGFGLKTGQLLGSSIFDTAAQGGAETEPFFRAALAGELVQYRLNADDVQWEVWLTPLRDAAGEVDVVLGFSLDVSEASRTEEALRSRIEQVEKQREVIRDLSTPIIDVWDGVLTLPMVGVVDSIRTAEVMDSLLSRIVEKQARFAILDLTGVEVVDTQVASHLIELVTAIRLLGAEGIVAGIKANVAQTMIALGLDLSQISTQRNLRAALAYAIRRMNTQSTQKQLQPPARPT